MDNEGLCIINMLLCSFPATDSQEAVECMNAVLCPQNFRKMPPMQRRACSAYVRGREFSPAVLFAFNNTFSLVIYGRLLLYFVLGYSVDSYSYFECLSLRLCTVMCGLH